MRRAARAAAGRDRPPGRTPGRRASDAPQCGGAPRRRLDSYERNPLGQVRGILPPLGGARALAGGAAEDVAAHSGPVEMTKTTLGRTFTGSDGKTYRPSMFVTLTLPSYGRVLEGAPLDPDRYDYARAARDALYFSKLVDRFVQNLRRVAGYDVQYFATVEPQKRLAPHLHMAIRGTPPRAELRQIIAATYHQVWWPSTDIVRFEGDHLPAMGEIVKQGLASASDDDDQAATEAKIN
ncbi:replication initiator [Microbispora siamensis]